MPDKEIFMAVCIGIALSAACGFRVFLPLLGLGLLVKFGVLTLSPGFEWIASLPAIVTFTVASVVEIVAYYIPVVDHALDVITTPTAIAAATLIQFSLLGDTSPYLKWTLAIIAGGATAGAIKGGLIHLRGISSFTTLGLGNPIVSTLEWMISLFFILVAIFIPVLAMGLIVVPAILIYRWVIGKHSTSPLSME